MADETSPLHNAPSAAEVTVIAVSSAGASERPDNVAVEEPLEIRLGFGPRQKRTWKSIAVTMRTPGHDLELAAGFLWTEGIVTTGAQIARIGHRGLPAPGGHRNAVQVELTPEAVVDTDRLERHFYTTSSCGVCGKASIDAVQIGRPEPTPLGGEAVWSAEDIHRMPRLLREAQAVFERTGGLHAAALFDTGCTLLCLREDVGRHNAMDKVIGAQALAGRLPLVHTLLFVSGRASFELVQKALMAGIPALAAVGAPSSLAVELARDAGMTLLGFVRDDRFNIYAGPERIQGA
jgi:FdhD protein